MIEPVNLLLAGAALLALLGFAWLALAMETHWEQVHGQPGPAPRHRMLLRLLGAVMIVASLGLCLQADHATMAALVWTMLLAGSAVANALVLSWQPHWLRRVWPCHA